MDTHMHCFLSENPNHMPANSKHLKTMLGKGVNHSQKSTSINKTSFHYPYSNKTPLFES